jgi:hypothetical protein
MRLFIVVSHAHHPAVTSDCVRDLNPTLMCDRLVHVDNYICHIHKLFLKSRNWDVSTTD